MNSNFKKYQYIKDEKKNIVARRKLINIRLIRLKELHDYYRICKALS